MSQLGRQTTLIHQALAAYRAGDLELALRLGRESVQSAGKQDFSGHAIVAETLSRSNRISELESFLDSEKAFQKDPRGLLMQARLQQLRGESSRSVAVLDQILKNSAWTKFHRVAGFELCKVHDQLGDYDRAWRCAVATHQQTTKNFPVDQLVEIYKVTASADRTELRSLPKASKNLSNTACFLGLPRSGTTIIEQALDCHSRIHGVGENPVVGQSCDQIALEGGGWPIGASKVTRATLDRLQSDYLDTVRTKRSLSDSIWTLDKTVWPTMQPLFINAVLPGAKVLRSIRDARDNAVSLFLNNMDPSWGWTGNISSIRKVIEAERRFIPVIIEKLGLEFIEIRLEDLADDPRQELQKAIQLLNLEWEDDCLYPERNDRLVLTLSHSQVRSPFNRNGIGRWKNYAEFFDDSWSEL